VSLVSGHCGGVLRHPRAIRSALGGPDPIPRAASVSLGPDSPPPETDVDGPVNVPLRRTASVIRRCRSPSPFPQGLDGKSRSTSPFAQLWPGLFPGRAVSAANPTRDLGKSGRQGGNAGPASRDHLVQKRAAFPRAFPCRGRRPGCRGFSVRQAAVLSGRLGTYFLDLRPCCAAAGAVVGHSGGHHDPSARASPRPAPPRASRVPRDTRCTFVRRVGQRHVGPLPTGTFGTASHRRAGPVG